MRAVLAILAAGALVCATQQAFAQGRAGAETEEDQTFQAAERALKAGEDDEAARLYERVIGLNPSRADAYIKRAALYYRHREYGDAVAFLRKAQQVLPDDNGIKAQLGLSLYRSGAKDLAVAVMEEVAQKSPQSYQVQWQLGEYWITQSNGEKAAKAFGDYFKFRPQEASVADFRFRRLAGAAYLMQKKWSDAEKELAIALKLQPSDPLTRISMATAFTGQGEYAKAAAIYEKLVASEGPKQPSIYYNLGECLLRTNRRGEAEKLAEQYTRAQPRQARGWVLLGDARMQGRDINRALDAYAQAARLEPSSPAIAAKVGKVQIAQRNYVGAVATLEKAHADHPDDEAVLTQLAEAYAVTRPGDKAVLVPIATQLSMSPDADAATAAAVAFFAAGDDAQAESAFNNAMAIDAQALRPRIGLQMTLDRAAGKKLAAGDLAGAEALLVRAQKLDPESLQTNRNLGLVLLLEKKYGESEKALAAAHKRLAKDLTTNRLLARVRAATGRRDEAIASLREAEAAVVKARGPVLAQVYVELAPLLVQAGKLDDAVALAGTAIKEGAGTSVIAAAQRNLGLALLARGASRVRDARTAEGAVTDFRGALDLPSGTLQAKEAATAQCGLAVASLKVGKPGAVVEALDRAAKLGGCGFAAPYDKVGAEFFAAYAGYREAANPAKLESVARALAKLEPRVSGALGETVRELVRSTYEIDGVALYARNENAKAAAALKAAASTRARGEHRVLDHNLAVLDLNDGRLGAAEKALDALGGRPPESLLNLGIVHDRQGDARKALELYRRAWERGVRVAKLRDWIDVKERLLGGVR